MSFDLHAFRDEYPFTSRYLSVGGPRLHYVDEGQGEPIVFVHGNPTWSFFFRGLIRGLSSEFRAIALDHIGCGASDKPGDDEYEYVLERRVRDLDALITHLGLKKVTLVLHDWGGMIGLLWAIRNVDRVARIVVMNTAGFGLPPGRRLPWQIAVVRHLPFFALAVRGAGAFSRGAIATCTTRPMPQKIAKAYLAPYDSWSSRIAVQRFVEDIPLQPGDRSFTLVEEVSLNLERLAKIPLLVLWGEKDFVFDAHFLAEWRRRMPHGEFHTFADAGHYLLEDAGDRILPIVREFVGRSAVAAAESRAP